MSLLKVRLFGKFSVQCNEQHLRGLDAAKVRELFCYLLCYRDRPHPRETLADLLWGDSTTAQSKKYLRQALWQLQTALSVSTPQPRQSILTVELDWVRLNSQAELWLDIAIFERAARMLGDKPQQELDATKIKLLHEAAALYQDDLLPGWYQDWCLYERERLQNMYQLMLDKLMGYCEAHQEYETGIIYGQQILRFDRASERTHQRLMRLHYLAGDRTAALRQYERCLTALRDDLDVKPAKATMALCEQIRTDNLDGAPSESARAERASSTPATLPEVLGHLKRLRLALSDIQRQVQQDIQALEVAYTTTTDSEDPAKVQRATAALSK